MGNWLPGARVIKATQDGGSMIGGAPRVVWHTTENDPTKTKASDIANFLNRTGDQVHLVWNPVTGEVVQMIPANRAARGLENHPGGVETNRYGSVCIQIEVVGQAIHPFTNTACKGLDKIVSWLRGHGIKDQWPAGKSIAYPASYGENGHRDPKAWAKGGHYEHENVPENVHGDAGAIDQAKILAAGKANGSKTLISDPLIGQLQTAVHVTATKKWGSSTNKALEAVRNGYPTSNVEYLQARVGTTVDGNWGKNSKAAYANTVRRIQYALKSGSSGKWDHATEVAYEAAKKRFYNVYVVK